MPYSRFLLISGCTVLGLLPQLQSANAIEKPIYRDSLATSAKTLILHYLSENNFSEKDYEFAEIDLNGDNYPEYLVKTSKCTENHGFCQYLVLAEKKENIISLLFLEAKDVTISDTKTNGIHDILAIQSKKNDYKYERYVWSSVEMIFKPDKPQIEGQ